MLLLFSCVLVNYYHQTARNHLLTSDKIILVGQQHNPSNPALWFPGLAQGWNISSFISIIVQPPCQLGQHSSYQSNKSGFAVPLLVRFFKKYFSCTIPVILAMVFKINLDPWVNQRSSSLENLKKCSRISNCSLILPCSTLIKCI